MARRTAAAPSWKVVRLLSLLFNDRGGRGWEKAVVDSCVSTVSQLFPDIGAVGNGMYGSVAMRYGYCLPPKCFSVLLQQEASLQSLGRAKIAHMMVRAA